MTWPDGWHAVEGDGHGDEELRREVGSGHALFGVAVTAVARRFDRDDVLYRLEDGSGRHALVHLTWSRKRESSPAWPATELFASLAAFLAAAKATESGEP